MIRPATAGTNAVLPGTCLRWVHLRAVPGGQMQFWRQLIAISSIGVMAGSLEYTTSVSYTHLDVYKRQTLYHTSLEIERKECGVEIT